MRAGGRAAPGAMALALVRRCLLLGPLGLRSTGAQDGNGCGHTLLTPHSGTLSSKNYPGTYPNHTMCCWQLQAPPGTSLLLAFGDVDLEPSEHCALSSLLLTDPQTGTAYGPYCRNSVPSAPLLVTNSSTVTILFNSTSHRSGRGLLLSYATSQHPDLVSCLVRGTHYTQEHVSVYCPAGCKDIHGDIWGNPSQGYRDTSVLCKAAVHAGVIADELGGQVTLSREKGITLYESAFANGLRSKRGSLSEKRLIFHKVCDDVLEVVTFNASSWWHEVGMLGQDQDWVAERAALSTTGHSWAAEPDAKAAWLELDLGIRRNVTGIITKGSSEHHNYYVTSYQVSSSRDRKNWRPYRGSSGQEEKVFEGNADSQGEVSNAFIPPIVARYIRVIPQSWHQHIALKVALVGCQVARVRTPRPYVPSVPKEVLEPTSHPASHTPIPGIALDPEKAVAAGGLLALMGTKGWDEGPGGLTLPSLARLHTAGDAAHWWFCALLLLPPAPGFPLPQEEEVSSGAELWDHKRVPQAGVEPGLLPAEPVSLQPGFLPHGRHARGPQPDSFARVR
ncbi:discoidin, CUB and LCCL domain-containing protein 1-like isoform X5 [Oenanthe melanoleuca]|uniref:discoidin, CUB and LCCL domain-containing protein 1-like isoform X5 n=1 Tax=Oenanthe melanoleuca TaxID=2939378 RepID=UPI0024C144AC|nr:discoidin, CUB and LCCL domain-containing protein 1-like isoform X5 [Oenanthe melanoleuca]